MTGGENLYYHNCNLERNANVTRKTQISNFVFFYNIILLYMSAPKCIIEKYFTLTTI